MSDFLPAYNIVKLWEGNNTYAILKGDDGGETYGGIARNYVPNWEGWKIIDSKKPLKNGTHVPEADNLVAEYYRQAIWVQKGKCDKIENQQLANLVFDSCVQHGRAGRIINSAVMKFYNTQQNGLFPKGPAIEIVTKNVNGKVSKVPVNKITDETIYWLNKHPKEIYPLIWQAREGYYRADDDFDKFGKGWLNRLNSFPKVI